MSTSSDALQDSRVLKGLQLAKRTLYYIDPRLGILASSLAVRNKPDLPTYAATSAYMVIFLNEKLIVEKLAALSDADFSLVIAFFVFHEYAHHMLRAWKRMAMHGYDPQILNIAQDLVINYLAENAFGSSLAPLIDKLGVVTVRTFQFPEGLSTDAYYKLLIQDKEQTLQQLGGEDSAPGGGVGSCCSPDDGQGDDTGEGKTKLEMDRILAEGQDILDRVSQKSKVRGYTPHGLQLDLKLVDVRERIRWEDQLRDLYGHTINSISGANHSNWAQYSRRQSGLGFGMGCPIMPARKDYSPNIAVVLDTSGSMSDWIEKAVTHVYTLVEHAKSVRFLSCDAAVHTETDVRSADELLAAVKGGGGTDMTPAFNMLRDGRDFSPDVTICVTDGEIGDPGPTPPWEHIWVCNNTSFRPQWGHVIYVEHEGS